MPLDLNEHYKKQYPDEKRGYIDYAILTLIHSEMDRKLLDVGCGFGSYLSALNEMNFQCCGFTLTDYEVNVCKHKRLNVLKHDASFKFPYPSDSFESVIMIDSLEHIENYKNALLEIKRVLKKGGKILIYTPNKFYCTTCITHYHEFDHKELKDLISLDFENIKLINKKFYYPKYNLFSFLAPYTVKTNHKYICLIAEKGIK